MRRARRGRFRFAEPGLSIAGMNTVVIEHVPVAELPQAWRERLAGAVDDCVTVRIDAEQKLVPLPESEVPPEFADDPLFGMWRDREDMADVADYIRRIRAPRF